MIQLKKEVCAYIRVSSHGQEDYSPDAQLRLIEEYAAEHDMIVTGVYQDLGISGRSADKRTEFIRMIAECKDKSHPYDAILVWKFSRFARNQDESIVYKSLLKKEKVDVISISEPIPEGFAGGLIERILEWMDEYYSIRLSGEVRRGMTQKALNGGYNAQPPIGYIKERGPHTIPQIDVKYADMVRSIFNMYAIEQRSMLYIAGYLNMQGYRTRRGHKWENRNIAYIIQNPFYIGKIRWNNTERRSHCKEIVGETIIVQGQHEPLISEELWNAANERYNAVSAKYQTPHQGIHIAHWLSGMLKCPYCGGSLSFSKQPDYSYFSCAKRKRGQCTKTPVASIGMKKAETYVLQGLKEIIDNKKLEKLAPLPKQNDNNIEHNLMERLTSLTRQIDRLRESYLAGIDTLEEYKENRMLIKKEMDIIQEKLDSIKESTPSQPSLSHFESVYEFLYASAEPDDKDLIIRKNDALHSIVDHIVYNKETDSMEFFLRQ